MGAAGSVSSRLESADGLFRQLFEKAEDAIFLLQGRDFVNCNSKAVELFEVSREKLLTESPFSFSPEYQPDGERSEARAQRMLDKTLQEQPQCFKWQHERPNGDLFTVEVQFTRIEVNGEAWCQATFRRISTDDQYHRTRQFLKQTIESVGDAILVTNAEGGVEYYNQNFVEMWDIPDSVIDAGRDELAVEHVLDEVQNPRKFKQRIEQLHGDHEVVDRIKLKDGRIFKRHSKPLVVGQDPAGRVWSFRDVTERERREARLEETRTFLETIVQELPSMLIVKDAEDFRFEICNRAASEFFNMEKSDLEGCTDFDVLPEEQARKVRARDEELIEEGGSIGPLERPFKGQTETYWLSTRKVPIKDQNGRVLFIVTLVQDVTERKQAEKELKQARRELEEISNTDSLTGLRNRRYFDEAFEEEWARHRRNRNPISLVMVDIDCFKQYNDEYGHPRGDWCLKQVADSLASCLERPADEVARYGGEEFILLLPETNLDGARTVARQSLEAVRDQGIEHRGSDVSDHVTVSAGAVSVVPENDNREELLQRADDALYQSKKQGRDTVTVLE